LIETLDGFEKTVTKSISGVSVSVVPSFHLRSLHLSFSSPADWLVKVGSSVGAFSPSSLLVAFPGSIPKPYGLPLWSSYLLDTLKKLANELKVEMGNVETKERLFDNNKERKEVPFVLVLCKDLDVTVSVFKKNEKYTDKNLKGNDLSGFELKKVFFLNGLNLSKI
jgi:hypothetical protein